MEHEKNTEKQNPTKELCIKMTQEVFYKNVIKSKIKALEENSFYKSEMLKKANILKGHLDKVSHDFNFKHRCLNQIKQITIRLVSLQKYERRYEQSANGPVKFLIMKKSRISKSEHHTLHTNQIFRTTSTIKRKHFVSIMWILMPDIGKRKCIENEPLLKLMPSPQLCEFFNVVGVDNCRHISIITSDRVWVSGKENISLKNIKGDTLYYIRNVCHNYGVHTVNSKSELIYINRNLTIKKLSKDKKTTMKLVKTTNFKWRPQCLYWSPFTRDILVGMLMHKNKVKTGKVTRYNQSGQLTQTIQNDNAGLKLYSEPNYITENNNGDVVISDNNIPSGAVVVTDRGGRHRFSYTGPPSGSGLLPRGICTDTLLHILVCDGITKTVQMIDRDGQFLSYLLTNSEEMSELWSLSYDVNTDCLWVGSDNKIRVYRYLIREITFHDERASGPNGYDLSSPGLSSEQMY